MFGENASFIKSIEIDDSFFQCDPDCSKKYLLLLQWSADNEARQWKVVDAESVLTSNDESDHSAIGELNQTIKSLQEQIADLTERVEDLEG